MDGPSIFEIIPSCSLYHLILGINGMMQKFMMKINTMDPKVYERLIDQDIKPQYFSFR